MSLIALAVVLFAIGAVIVALERPGWSRAGFIIEACAAIIGAVALLT